MGQKQSWHYLRLLSFPILSGSLGFSFLFCALLFPWFLPSCNPVMEKRHPLLVVTSRPRVLYQRNTEIIFPIQWMLVRLNLKSWNSFGWRFFPTTVEITGESCLYTYKCIRMTRANASWKGVCLKFSKIIWLFRCLCETKLMVGNDTEIKQKIDVFRK